MENNIYSAIATASNNSPKLVGTGVMGFLLLVGGGLCSALISAGKQGRDISCGLLHISDSEKKENISNNSQKLNTSETE